MSVFSVGDHVYVSETARETQAFVAPTYLRGRYGVVIESCEDDEADVYCVCLDSAYFEGMIRDDYAKDEYDYVYGAEMSLDPVEIVVGDEVRCEIVFDDGTKNTVSGVVANISNGVFRSKDGFILNPNDSGTTKILKRGSQRCLPRVLRRKSDNELFLRSSNSLGYRDSRGGTHPTMGVNTEGFEVILP